MATESTALANNPEDNREEYEAPPCAETPIEGMVFDENGLEVNPYVNTVAS